MEVRGLFGSPRVFLKSPKPSTVNWAKQKHFFIGAGYFTRLNRPNPMCAEWVGLIILCFRASKFTFLIVIMQYTPPKPPWCMGPSITSAYLEEIRKTSVVENHSFRSSFSRECHNIMVLPPSLKRSAVDARGNGRGNLEACGIPQAYLLWGASGFLGTKF